MQRGRHRGRGWTGRGDNYLAASGWWGGALDCKEGMLIGGYQERLTVPRHQGGTLWAITSQEATVIN